MDKWSRIFDTFRHTPVEKFARNLAKIMNNCDVNVAEKVKQSLEDLKPAIPGTFSSCMNEIRSAIAFYGLTRSVFSRNRQRSLNTRSSLQLDGSSPLPVMRGQLRLH